MAFLNRLFNRKSKTEMVSSPVQPSLRRSLTDPQPSAMTPARGRRSSSDDRDTIDVLPGSRAAGPRRVRRVGCDFARSKTSVDVGSVRSSTSSAAEPASSSADGSKSQYRQMRALHRSRLHTILVAQDRTTKRPVVLKAFPKGRMSSSLRAKMEAEVNHLRDLAGVPGVVQYVTQFEDDDAVYIVMESCTGPTLIEFIANSGGRLSESVLVSEVLIPLTLLLVDLHRRGIVHRQIKPEHVLVAGAAVESLGAGGRSAGVTLVDFSEAVNKNQRCLNNRAGAMEYMAPELLNKPTAEEVFHQVLYNGMSEEELPQYDEKADVWSLGVLAFEALTGCQPFPAESPAEMGRLQRQLMAELGPEGGPLLFTGRPPLSSEARSFLTAALQLDPINRASAERLLQHPLLQRHWNATHTKAVAAAAAAADGRPAPPHSGPTPPPVKPLGGGGAAAAATAAAAAAAAAAGGGSASLGNGQSPTAAAATAAAAMAAAAAAAAAASSRGAAGGGGTCAAPVAAQKPSLLATAPLQFPVR